MQKVYNGEHIEGRIFTHELKIKTVQNGTLLYQTVLLILNL